MFARITGARAILKSVIKESKARRSIEEMKHKKWASTLVLLAFVVLLWAGCRNEMLDVNSDRELTHLIGCRSSLKNISTAMEMYASDNQKKYPPSVDRLMPNYLITSLPTCPAAGKMTYGYMVRSDFGLYTLYCQGNYHRKLLKPGFPQYDSYGGERNGSEGAK